MARYMESRELVWLMSRLALRNTFSDLKRGLEGGLGGEERTHSCTVSSKCHETPNTDLPSLKYRLSVSLKLRELLMNTFL